MANFVIRDLVSEIRGGFFSIICDEYTDISNKEQLTICIRWVDEQLEAHEDFFGFNNRPDIGAETIVSAVKDVLPLANCERTVWPQNWCGEENPGPSTEGLSYSYSLSWTFPKS